jgi:hypothetical protein
MDSSTAETFTHDIVHKQLEGIIIGFKVCWIVHLVILLIQLYLDLCPNNYTLFFSLLYISFEMIKSSSKLSNLINTFKEVYFKLSVLEILFFFHASRLETISQGDNLQAINLEQESQIIEHVFAYKNSIKGKLCDVFLFLSGTFLTFLLFAIFYKTHYLGTICILLFCLGVSQLLYFINDRCIKANITMIQLKRAFRAVVEKINEHRFRHKLRGSQNISKTIRQVKIIHKANINIFNNNLGTRKSYFG